MPAFPRASTRPLVFADSLLASEANGIAIENVSREWEGWVDSESSSSFAGPLANRRRWHPPNSADQTHQFAHSPGLQHGNSWGTLYAIVRKAHIRFLIFTFLHVVDVVLKIISLAIVSEADVVVFCTLLSIVLLAVTFACYSTFSDADVIRILQSQGSWLAKGLLTFLAFIVMGCLQMIAIKKAWSHQLVSDEIISDIGEEINRQREHAAHVVFLTGVPFIFTNQYVYFSQCLDGNLSVTARFILKIASLCAACIVGFAILEIDLSVSKYVKQRYQAKVSQSGCLQRLYPLTHVTFRTTEVLMSLTILAVAMALFSRKHGLIIIGYIVVDYFGGVLVLMHASKGSGERCYIQLVLGVPLAVTNLAFFVDRAEFAYPARVVTRYLEGWRLFKLVIVVLLLESYSLFGENCSLCFVSIPIGVWRTPWLQPLLVISSLLYYTLRWILARSKGHDLHTACMKGELEQVKRFLSGGLCGEGPDINARTRDKYLMTPAMLAASNGHLIIMQLLFDHNAMLDLRNVQGDTCLHLAAKRGQVEVIDFLLLQAHQKMVKNVSGNSPLDLAVKCRQLKAVSRLQEISSELQLSVYSMTRKREPGRLRYSVLAPLCAADELRALFPDCVAVDVPVPAEAKSVPGFIFSVGAGILKSFEAGYEELQEGNHIPLSSLRRVGELGKGGFGTVIEVEQVGLNGERGSRFAMKLQRKESTKQQAYLECKALLRVCHPFITRLEQAFQTGCFFVLLMELCPCDLNALLVRDDIIEHGLPPKRVARYSGHVLLALVYLHEKLHIVYRDLKPDNVLISTKDEAKLTDFGLAKEIRLDFNQINTQLTTRTWPRVLALTVCGTRGFMAPEILDGIFEDEHGYDPFKVDSYSFGVTLSLMLLGERGGERREIKNKGAMLLPRQESTEILLQSILEDSQLIDAHDLLKELLYDDPEQRRRLRDPYIKGHPFYIKTLGCQTLEDLLLMY